LVQYPGDCNADATISGTYTVKLIQESIDDLTVCWVPHRFSGRGVESAHRGEGKSSTDYAD
jgi:hypothetical protein